MKISHEVPICLLEHNIKWSHYDYILPHLLDKFPEYESYMRSAKEKGRYLIMDNSLHELGEPYSEERLLYWINELKPNEFIVPDLWENYLGTFHLAVKWNEIKLPIEVTKVAVVQSKRLEDTIELYKKYKEIGYKKIAFSYGAEYYKKIFPHPNTNMSKALGRLKVISTLYSDGLIEKNDRIHLLGCQVPQEFGWYKDISCIETIDTSNPITAGFEEKFYDGHGLDYKPKTKIDDIIDISYYDIESKLSIIKYNINKFKSLNNIH